MKAWLPPVLLFGCLILVWEVSVWAFDIPKFLLPAPTAVAGALWENSADFLVAGLATLRITLIALGFAVLSGVVLTLAFSLSRFLGQALYPIAIVLQVTPIVSVAPLILIWVGIDHVDRALVIIAWLAAFFPILTNLMTGLRQVDPTLVDLFRLYKASRWQRFWMLTWPSAIPYLLAGVKISSGLALIGAVVAEFVAGSGGSTGLAWRILEAGNRLQVPKMFAGLIILSAMGVVLFYCFSALERVLVGRLGVRGAVT